MALAAAVAAEAGLYAGLHQISNVSMPAWTHHATRPDVLPWPTIVGVAVVKPGAAPTAVSNVPALPTPVLSPPPAVVLEPPELIVRK